MSMSGVDGAELFVTFCVIGLMFIGIWAKKGPQTSANKRTEEVNGSI
jgi:hypothetical protein